MGAYLSEPVTDKISSDESSDILSCGASSMQGWRVSQEDSHNCELNFDEGTSLFAVYDGHGGAEVAKYCAEKLPDYIKNTKAYKDGKYSDALEEAFLGFDATIATTEVVDVLKAMCRSENELNKEEEDDIDEEEEVSNLFEEATMPLEDIIAKYQEGKVNTATNKLKVEGASEKVLSPYLRPKRAGCSRDKTAGCSSSLKTEESDPVTSSTTADKSGTSNESQVSTSNGEVKPDSETPAVSSNAETPKKSQDKSMPDSSEDMCDLPSPSKKQTEPAKKESSPVKQDQCNGDVTNSKSDEVKENVTSSSHENGDLTTPTSIKGKSLAKTSGVPSTENSKSPSESDSTDMPVIKKRMAAVLYNSLLGVINAAEDDDSDSSNDETFKGKEEESSSEDEAENTNGVNEESSDEENGEEDTSDEDDEDMDEEMDDFTMSIKNEPGSDSGCTAVVALLKDNQLFVANAGDSRCIVCRDGKAVDMSIDHKPEDDIELSRIVKAGGKVSTDGRVNGGLNLSRAIGDLGYKQNKELGAKEQMITALPDVKILTIDPTRDKFMVLACDGIWNSMTSQEVVDFVQSRLAKGVNKLSQICEEMFNSCLSPNTAGDGTGCDNMTAVIVRFKFTSKKRPSDDEQLDEEATAKRSKTEQNISVTSSVL